MTIPTWLRPPRGVHWSPKLGVALVLVFIAGVVALSGVIHVLGALFTFGGDADPTKSLQVSIEKHMKLSKLDRERFDGRSAFFMPAPPVSALPKPPPAPKIVKPAPPPAPVIPTEYTGKKPFAIVGPIVFFETGQLRVGEEKDGIKVISTNAPWSVKLGYEGGEFDVPIWAQKKEDFFSGKWPATRSIGIDSAAALGDGKEKGGRSASHSAAATPPTASATSPSSTPPKSEIPQMPRSGSMPGMGSPGMGSPGMGPGMGSPGMGSPGIGPGGSLPPSGAPNPDGSPAGVEPPRPVQPPVPNQSNEAEKNSAKISPSASDNKGWNPNQMAAPPPISAEQMNNMQMSEVLAAQAGLRRVQGNKSLDGPTAERVANELAQLTERINDLKKGQSPPP